MDVAPTATLTDCIKEQFGSDYRVWGFIKGDTKGRFCDGRWLHTSKVTSYDSENKIIHTLNSSYLIENWK